MKLNENSLTAVMTVKNYLQTQNNCVTPLDDVINLLIESGFEKFVENIDPNTVSHFTCDDTPVTTQPTVF